MNLYWSKSSSPDCIAVVVLKNCEPEYSYILADLFNKCLKEFCFVRTFHVMVLVFKNVGERSATKNYCHVALISVLSKVFEKLANNKIVDKNMAFILISSVALRLLNLTYISDRITGAFNRSRATRTVPLDISKVFDRVWYASLLHKLKSHGISGQIFGLILLFSAVDGFKWFWMKSLRKNIQLMLELLKAPYLILHFSCYTLMTFLRMLSVILLSMLIILISVLSVIRHLICVKNLN